MPKKKARAEERPTEIRVPIEWHFREETAAHYVTHMVVQHTEHEFHISFFEARPPLLLGTPEEQREAAERIGSVRAECVARIIVAPGRMQEFIDVVQDNLNKYLSKKDAGREHA